ncbi:MAG: tyrosine-type recombinase/integrase [Chloroflexota bacterium]
MGKKRDESNENEQVVRNSEPDGHASVVAMNAGQHNISGADSDDQMVDLFISTRRSRNTREVYSRAIEGFRRFLGYTPFREMTVTDLNRYREWLHESHRNKSTIRNKFMPIKSFLTYAQKVGYIQFNVGSAVAADSVHQVIEDKVLTEQQVFKLLDRLKNPKHQLMVYLLYASGGRINEFINLAWKDVQDNYIIFRETKGDKLRRVPIAASVMEMLREYKVDTNAPTSADDYVFQAYYGRQFKQMTRHAVNDFLRRISKELGYKVTPHMLRHSIATHSINRGTSVHTLRDRLGHSSIAVTNVYLHSDDDEPLQSAIL